MATIILIILGPWENFMQVLRRADLSVWTDDSFKQGTAIIYGMVLSFVHPFFTFISLIPLPWNLTLIFIDVLVWLIALFFYQLWYFMRINIWYADLIYQLSVRMILQYDRTCAFLISQWLDSLLIIFFSPVFLLAAIGDAIWYDTYNTRAVTNQVISWTYTCNIDYYNDGPYKNQGTPCYADDPALDNGAFTAVDPN